MIFWLVLVVFAVVVTLFLVSQHSFVYSDPMDIWCYVGLGALAAFFSALVLACAGLFVPLFVADYDESATTTTILESERQDIIALADSTGVAGSFFLGNGSVDNELCYVYAIEENGFKTIKTISANNVWIDDSGEMNPCIEYATVEVATPLINPDHIAFKLFWLPSERSRTEYRTIIHIPPDSMTTTYNIDLK